MSGNIRLMGNTEREQNVCLMVSTVGSLYTPHAMLLRSTLRCHLSDALWTRILRSVRARSGRTFNTDSLSYMRLSEVQLKVCRRSFLLQLVGIEEAARVRRHCTLISEGRRARAMHLTVRMLHLGKACGVGEALLASTANTSPGRGTYLLMKERRRESEGRPESQQLYAWTCSDLRCPEYQAN